MAYKIIIEVFLNNFIVYFYLTHTYFSEVKQVCHLRADKRYFSPALFCGPCFQDFHLDLIKETTTNMQKTYLTLLLCFLVQATYGQYQIGIIPRVSPDKAVHQKIGYTEVEVAYGSPAVKNRPIWGDLVPYQKVWRAGANNATTLSFRSKVKIADVTVDSGEYALFVIPKENDKWTIILNKTSKQWGAFKYDVSQDLLRLEISPRWIKSKTEHLSYSINQTGYRYGSIVLAWDFIELEIPFETNYLVDFEHEIETRASAQPEYIKWIPYLQGAEHLEQLGANLDLADRWLNKAEDIMHSTSEWNAQFYPRDYVKAHLFWTKAKVLAGQQHFKEAIQYVDQLKNMEHTTFYDKKNGSEEIDLRYDSWKKN